MRYLVARDGVANYLLYRRFYYNQGKERGREGMKTQRTKD